MTGRRLQGYGIDLCDWCTVPALMMVMIPSGRQFLACGSHQSQLVKALKRVRR